MQRDAFGGRGLGENEIERGLRGFVRHRPDAGIDPHPRSNRRSPCCRRPDMSNDTSVIAGQRRRARCLAEARRRIGGPEIIVVEPVRPVRSSEIRPDAIAGATRTCNSRGHLDARRSVRGRRAACSGRRRRERGAWSAIAAGRHRCCSDAAPVMSAGPYACRCAAGSSGISSSASSSSPLAQRIDLGDTRPRICSGSRSTKCWNTAIAASLSLRSDWQSSWPKRSTIAEQPPPHRCRVQQVRQSFWFSGENFCRNASCFSLIDARCWMSPSFDCGRPTCSAQG